MTGVLGYAKYGAQGGDLANGIQVQLGRTYPNSLVGLHFNGIAISAAPLPPEAEQTPEERAYVRALAAYRLTELWITTVNNAINLRRWRSRSAIAQLA